MVARILRQYIAGVGQVGRRLWRAVSRQTVIPADEVPLTEAEKWFRVMVNSTQEGIWVLDADQQTRYANWRMAEMLGYTPERLVGRSLFDFLTPASAEEVQRRLERRRQGLSDQYEVCFCRQDGSLLWAIISANPLPDDTGQFGGSLAMVTNITERKQAQQALQQDKVELEQRIEQRTLALRTANKTLQQYADEVSDLYNRAPCGYHSLDTNGLFLRINDTELQWLGYTRVEIVNQIKFPDLLTPRSQITFEKNFPIFKHQGFINNLEFELVCKDGSIIYVLLSATAITDQRGRYTMSRSTLFDITKLKQTQDALRASEERYRMMAENVTDMISRHTAAGVYTYVSPACRTLLGYEPAEIIGKSVYDFIHPDDVSAISQFHLSALEAVPAYRMTLRVLKKDGTCVWIEAVSRTLSEPVTGTREVIAISRDVSQRKLDEENIRQLNESLSQRAEELQTANRELETALGLERELTGIKNRFLSIVSHEFRTPLSVILTSSDLLDRYNDRLPVERRQACYETIRNQVKSLSHMLDDVSTVIRAETGRLEFNPTALNLETLCQGIMEETRTTIGVAHHLFFDFWGDLADIYADPKLIQHMLRNLLTNAVKYSPPGRDIRLDVIRDTWALLIQVSDEGLGIPEADQSRLFEPYFRASNVRDINGTGIGLKIIKDAVDLHGGQIEVLSREGEGTTFIIYLPQPENHSSLNIAAL
ncbi:MAG TPA: PAS domain S-box protein [Phototrophicaceae bacterium]|nr:PAS domain S-box protein [Phototrophicaceae bacterium]